ncbi:TIGR02221 family CRISPR-associated protein [Desulfoscipio gibsoniae]
MIKALSFLGLPTPDKNEKEGRYSVSEYIFNDKFYRTELFPEAVVSIFNPDSLIIFVTPQAKKHSHYSELKSRVEDNHHVLFQPVDISEGKSEAELWEFFDKVTDVVNPGDEVILDITHAMRSIPLMAFIAMAYLRVAKDAKLKKIVYGAFVRGQNTNDVPKVPVFDLTPLEQLLEWLAAVDALKRRDDAGHLAELLTRAHAMPYKEGHSETPEYIRNTANALNNICQSLHLARPADTSSYVKTFLDYLPKVQQEMGRWAKPFNMLLEEVAEQYRPFYIAEPQKINQYNLNVQLRLIERFLDKGLVTQAITLSREWMVSLLAMHLDIQWFNKKRRLELENALGAAAMSTRSKDKDLSPYWWDELPMARKLADHWNFVTELRNDVAHCGMRENPAGIASINNRACDLPNLLHKLLEGFTNFKEQSRDTIMIDLKEIYGEIAKLDKTTDYISRVLDRAGEGKEVVITGQGPVWLYLKVAHALHGKAKRLFYNSLATGLVTVFDHDPN